MEAPADPVSAVDPEVADAIAGELERQEAGLELIASENHVSPAVLAAAGSCLTNKYAEGYPGARYYGGCEHVDRVEKLAIERLKAIFGAEHANVQPHSGTQANMAVLAVLANPGDTILSMSLSHGGHLSHGHLKNFSGKTYRFFHYGVDRKTETIQMEEVRTLAREHRPKVILAGASAYPRTLDFAGFAAVAGEVGASLLVDMAHVAGLVAAGLHPNPVPMAPAVTFTTHKTLRGPRGGAILCREGLRKAIDSAIFPGTQGGPLMHVIAAKAVAFREAMSPGFRTYQEAVVRNARILAERLAARSFRIVSGGTDNHMMLVDLRPKGLTGKSAEATLQRVGITVNKNLIPFDERPPVETSGIRIGTPAVTTRGLGEKEMDSLASWIDRALSHPSAEEVLSRIREEVRELCRSFPVYPGLQTASRSARAG